MIEFFIAKIILCINFIHLIYNIFFKILSIFKDKIIKSFWNYSKISEKNDNSKNNSNIINFSKIFPKF